MFAEVALSISTFKTFTYKIPSNLISIAQVGLRVKVPFGNRSLSGIIISLKRNTLYDGDIKNVLEIIDDSPVFTKELWELIEWISYYYITPIGKVFNSALSINISNNYKPQMNWYAQYIASEQKNQIKKLKNNAPKQYQVYQKIKKAHPTLLKISLLRNICSNPLSTCRSLELKKLIKILKKDKKPTINDFSLHLDKKKIQYNSDQSKVLKELNKSIDNKKFKPHLLHGVTGSGKTEVFIEIIKKIIDQGKTAIILIPEISLTPQIGGRFKSIFGSLTTLWHSKLTKSQRASTWLKIKNGDYKIVIGARSAIFTPLKNLGLIIVDEEHDSSYKQDSPSPRYHARDVAIMRAKIENVTIILSSATPSLESYHNYKINKYNYLSLPNRYGKAIYPKVKIVDLIKEGEESGKRNIVISGVLLDNIENKLNKNEQILLIQNRRGFSPSVRCSDCGEVAMCSACKTPLTYHRYDNNLKCHLCGYIELESFDNCKICLSSNLFYMGTGTQKVENILKETFPQARISRVDHDSVKGKLDIVNTLQAFHDGEIDILIGTQMIAKGLDFPDITLVGIINADLGLHIPDFRSSERIFQLIYQASGRSGRGEKEGQVIIQTYDSENPVIKAAAKLDLNEYYKIMLEDRFILKYPPYSWIIKIEFIGPKSKSVRSLSNKIRRNLLKKFKGLEILGPAPCFKEKIKNNYRYQLILKSLKKYDSNGEKIHLFINDNFIKHNNSGNGLNKINIHVDPMSMI